MEGIDCGFEIRVCDLVILRIDRGWDRNFQWAT